MPALAKWFSKIEQNLCTGNCIDRLVTFIASALTNGMIGIRITCRFHSPTLDVSDSTRINKSIEIINSFLRAATRLWRGGGVRGFMSYISRNISQKMIAHGGFVREMHIAFDEKVMVANGAIISARYPQPAKGGSAITQTCK